MNKKVYSSVHINVAFGAIPFAVLASKPRTAAGHISNAAWCSHPRVVAKRNGVAKETVTSASSGLYHVNAATAI